jgi:uncharacterized protein (TIGR02452 family)
MTAEERREMNKEVFLDTMETWLQKDYIDLDDFKLDIREKRQFAFEETFLYKDEILLQVEKKFDTKITVENIDCLNKAEEYILKITNPSEKGSQRPTVLNMANRRHPGGGVFNGSNAQEENLFRRTNLFLSLFPYSPEYAKKFGFPKQKNGKYPLDKNFGGIYSNYIEVFKDENYYLMENPFFIAVITVPALNRPVIYKNLNGEYRIADSLIEPTKNKIRTILNIAAIWDQETLVLSAFGCGAFRNPPKHMAELFKEVLEEDTYKNRFKEICFAILDDHNSRKEHNPEGNYKPFKEVFG